MGERSGYLFVVAGDHGHLNPVLPAAHALVARGHDVSFVAPAAACDAVRRHGFAAAAAGPADGIHAFVPETEVTGAMEREELPARLVKAGERFAALGHAMAGDVLAAGVEPPAVVVRETTAWAGWLLGDAWDVPVATIDFSRLPDFVRRAWAGPLNRWQKELRLVPDPDLASIDRWLGISPVPAGWLHPAELAPTTHVVRPAGPWVEPGTPPPWLGTLEPPVVYATLGTAFNRTAGAWQAVLDAAAGLPVSVVATVGDSIDPADFGPLPARVRVERYVPQELVLPSCHAVVGHGGFGTLTAALTAGLPVVSLPLGAADNLDNALRVERLGAGVMVPPETRSAASVRDALVRVLHDPDFRSAAEAVAVATDRLPPPAHAATLLERLAATGAPVTRPAGTEVPAGRPSG